MRLPTMNMKTFQETTAHTGENQETVKIGITHILEILLFGFGTTAGLQHGGSHMVMNIFRYIVQRQYQKTTCRIGLITTTGTNDRRTENTVTFQRYLHISLFIRFPNTGLIPIRRNVIGTPGRRIDTATGR